MSVSCGDTNTASEQGWTREATASSVSVHMTGVSLQQCVSLSLSLSLSAVSPGELRYSRYHNNNSNHYYSIGT